MAKKQHEPISANAMHDPDRVVDLFKQAARLSLECPLRKGATVHLPDKGRLLMTGDLHDHGYNFQRILHLARLEESEDNHLILHEVIHGEHKIEGRDLSVRMLIRVADLKCRYPGQVHIMFGNHELAQLAGEGISKAGISVVEVFDEGLDFIYTEDVDDVREAMNDFIRAMLLAVKCPNDIFCSHSLPGTRALDRFDPEVIHRIPTPEDLTYQGSAYDMVWGRSHNQDLADDLADDWHTRLFVMGHQPAPYGYERETETMLILASDHSHGVVLPFDLNRKFNDMDELIGEIIPLASVSL